MSQTRQFNSFKPDHNRNHFKLFDSKKILKRISTLEPDIYADFLKICCSDKKI